VSRRRFTTFSPARRARPKRLAAAAALLGICVGCSGAPASAPQVPAAAALPGQQTWAKGVSSFIFGINQSFDWAGTNLENTPGAQQTLKQTGFTLIRTFFSEQHLGWPFHPGTTTDADLELRFQSLENSGGECLGVLYVADDAQFNSSLTFLDHVLTYAETSKPGRVRCRLWEYGNEYGNMATYLRRWNTDVPYLRRRHPGAKFIGPVLAGPYLDQMQAFLDGVKASGVLPDGISYHDYPCYKSPDYVDNALDAAACDALITPSYGQTITKVRDMVKRTLGRDLPVGITEWNVSPNFVNLVSGKIPLTISPTYQPHFIKEIYAAMEAGGLAFAAHYDAMCGCGVGTAGALDLFDPNGVARPWISAFRSEIAAAR
jgi:hypothetical protein